MTQPLQSGAAEQAGEIKQLPLDLIHRAESVQSRAQLDRATVEEYAESMRAGAVFPPAVVFFDGARHWLADGFHRAEAAERAERATLLCEVRRGGRRAAMLHSAGANAKHGLKRSPADKWRAAEMLLSDEEWSKWSDHEIARVAGLSKTFIGKVRRRLRPASAEGPRLARRGAQVYEIRPGTSATAQDRTPAWLRQLVSFSSEQLAEWGKIVNGRADIAVVSEAANVVARGLAGEAQAS